ncbi:c-type cytochrome biogenesis protein CcmI [Bosea caraganae]|uniref:C-type cytochrome biogenesis protein CcmI n=1 Tax=Bosea caraganae TaxID=2763117 RepID=A0A370L3M7_9HYPH|nr:c-type cytochrome biogenesis protein CcmI [Bosea caraganae]RDJ22983.1 c-type cytochrome biogenesis protein CcmI [Bosea caraganae]RDJ28763.1 c-type cytochrome biogenesis protein CcmI [Bosea caraganae]
MLIWIIFAAMTGAAVFALLWPLGRRSPDAFADTADAKSLYRAQLGEIDRDLGRGLLGAVEADAARAEAARRLLRTAEGEPELAGESEPALRRRRAASALALSCVPLLALLLYGALGSPSHPDQPLSARLQSVPSQQDFELALARIETHLAANPSDGRGWAVIAPVYLRQGRFDDAARAFAAAIRHDGTSADRLAGLGEARTFAAGGVVTGEALQAFSEAVALDAKNPRARFFLAVAKEQDGDNDAAVAALRALLADAPPDAGWTGMVQQRLESLAPGSTAGSTIASLPAADQQAAIRGMVDGLAERLKQGGGTLPEWTRLIRSQLVLGNRPAAIEAIATARQRLGQDAEAVAQLDALAGELNLREPQP